MPLKRILKRAFPSLHEYYIQRKLPKHIGTLLVCNDNSFLHTTGWLRSLSENKPLDAEGNQIPWMNYPIVNLLKERLKKDLLLFEFGSGFSTLFYAGLVRRVVCVEHDEKWYELQKESLPENAEIVFRNMDVDGEYCRTILNTGNEWDVVVVDGRDRVNCVKQSIDTLSERGVVVLDDSSRERYQEGISFAKSRGFRALSIESFKATGIEIDRTTILYRDGNCLGI